MDTQTHQHAKFGRTGPRSHQDFLCIGTLSSASASASLAYHHCLGFIFLSHYFVLPLFRHGLSIPPRMSIFLCLSNILQENKDCNQSCSHERAIIVYLFFHFLLIFSFTQFFCYCTGRVCFPPRHCVLTVRRFLSSFGGETFPRGPDSPPSRLTRRLL